MVDRAACLLLLLSLWCPLQAYSETGVPQWPGDVPVDTYERDQAIGVLGDIVGHAMASDGAGGTFLFWEDEYAGNIRAQRIAASGQIQWAVGGIAVAPGAWYQLIPRAVSDGAGGAIVAWVDGRNGSCGPSFFGQCDVFAQRLDADGNALWTPGGVAVVTALDNQGTDGLGVVSDGAGGIIVTWTDARLSYYAAVYAQRIDADGQAVWETDGVPVSHGTTNRGTFQVVSDGVGGVIIAWRKGRIDGDTIMAQRLDAQGNELWIVGGVDLGLDNAIGPTDMISDGQGGAILPYTLSPVDSFLQRLSSTGTLLWPGGVAVSLESDIEHYPRLASDGASGAIVTWQDGVTCRHYGSYCDIYAQRVDATGSRLWGDAGIAVSAQPWYERAADLVADGSGGAVIVWNDCWNPDSVCMDEEDLFAQRVDENGQLLWGAGVPVSEAAGNQGVMYGAAELPASFVLLGDDAGGAIVAWPDGRNGRCRFADVGSNCDYYVQYIPEPSAGLLLVSGIAGLAGLSAIGRRS